VAQLLVDRPLIPDQVRLGVGGEVTAGGRRRLWRSGEIPAGLARRRLTRKVAGGTAFDLSIPPNLPVSRR